MIRCVIRDPIRERPMRFPWVLVWALALLSPCQLEGQTATGLTQSAAGTAAAQPALPEAPEARPESAEQERKQEENQRILGVIPNFSSTSDPNAPPLTPKQKLHLAFRSAIDPFQFLAAGLDAGYGQAENEFAGYGQGAQGYAKRFGAAYTDGFNGTMLGNAVFPILMHEDPRYFRKGTGSLARRFFYAVSTTVWSRRDNGSWGPNYSNVMGNFAAGGISNLYYPSTDRGAGLTVERALTVTAEGTIGAVLIEFWPDVSKRLHKKKNKKGTAAGSN